ncbi:unnamed protein product [Ectocarpus fasciculatus]
MLQTSIWCRVRKETRIQEVASRGIDFAFFLFCLQEERKVRFISRVQDNLRECKYYAVWWRLCCSHSLKQAKASLRRRGNLDHVHVAVWSLRARRSSSTAVLWWKQGQKLSFLHLQASSCWHSREGRSNILSTFTSLRSTLPRPQLERHFSSPCIPKTSTRTCLFLRVC